MKPEKNKSKIVEASLQLFCEKGFNSTSMKDIAEKAGVSPGNCYNHFKSKTELYEYIFKTFSPENYLEHLTAGVGPDRTIEENVAAALENIIGFIEKHPFFFKLILVDVSEFGGKHICDFSAQVIRPVESYLHGGESVLPNLRRDIGSVDISAFLVWLFYAIGVTSIIYNMNLSGSFSETSVYNVLLKVLQKGLRE